MQIIRNKDFEDKLNQFRHKDLPLLEKIPLIVAVIMKVTELLSGGLNLRIMHDLPK